MTVIYVPNTRKIGTRTIYSRHTITCFIFALRTKGLIESTVEAQHGSLIERHHNYVEANDILLIYNVVNKYTRKQPSKIKSDNEEHKRP